MSATQLVGPVALMSRSTKAGAGRVASPRVVALAERWRPARSLPACCISRATRLCPTRRPRPAIRRGCAGDHTPRGSNSRSPRCAPALSIPPRSRRLDTPLPENRNRLQTVRPPSPARHQHRSPADEPQRPCRGRVNPRPVAKRSPSSLSTYPQRMSLPPRAPPSFSAALSVRFLREARPPYG